jgi:hypothetical protein
VAPYGGIAAGRGGVDSNLSGRIFFQVYGIIRITRRRRGVLVSRYDMISMPPGKVVAASIY